MSRSLQFDIVANDKASAKLKEVQGAAGQFSRSIGGMVAGFLGIQAVLGKVTQMIGEAFTWGSELKNSASAVGLTVTQFQQLEYASKLAGVPVEKMRKAFLDLRKVMRDANDGNVQAVGVLKAMGYSQEEIASGNIDLMDAFLRVSKAISSATSEQEKFNIATAVFGDKVAQDLMKVLGDYKQLKQDISETPLISEADAEALDKAADDIDKFMARSKVFLAKTINLLDLTTMPWEEGRMQREARLSALGVSQPDAAAPSESDVKMAKALAEAGKRAGSSSSVSVQAQSALATIGGAAGFRAGAKSPELTALEKIEENTRPAGAVPINGSTNFSAGEAYNPGIQEFNAAAARVRNAPRRRDFAPR